MSELKKLKQDRTQLKASLTRFKNRAENCDPTVDASVSQLRERLRKIPETWDSFMDIQGQIEALVIDKEEAIENVERDGQAQREEFEEQYFEAMALAKERIAANEAAKVAAAALTIPVQQATTSTEQPQASIRMNIKLPSLTLPVFSGQYSQWLLFKDSFTSAINNNQSITDVQRFQYLRSSLKDEALQVIEALETSGENYKIAWDLLEAQYENRRLIVNTHLKEIIEMPSIAKDNRASLGQFVNHIRKHVRALESLKLPVKQWDTILIYLATSKLDFYTRRDWESNVGVRTIETLPTLEEFLKFLADKCHMLEMIDRDKNKSNDSKPTNSNIKRPDNRVALASTVQYACWFCKGSHSIFFCSELLKLPVQARIQEVKKLHLCLNCLRKGHISKDCKSSGCKHCSKQHNSILHVEQQDTHQGTAERESQQEGSSASVCAQVIRPCASQILLSTIQVDVYDSSGKLHHCRALLDPGSQSNIITKQLAKTLRLPLQSINLPIVGINQCRTNIHHSTRVSIRSRYDQSTDELECLVLPVITDIIPQVQVKSSIIKIPQHLRLADETYHMPGSVDLLIGAALFWQSLKPERINLAPNLPTLQHTKFGWILGGGIGNNQASSTVCNLLTYSGLDQQLQKYWEIEEVHYGPIFSKEQEYCQFHYKNTVMRDDSDRRFIVTLPKKANVKLGDSYEGAHRRLLSLENRFIKQPDLKEEYVRFMTEYEELGHMSMVDVSKDEPTKEIYYLPHHPIVRTDHLTTKLRVVFDGSAKSDSGASLNDKLMVGPTIQDTLFDIILRFRMYQFVMTADIAMMYRQILVSDADKDLQRILWRTDPHEPIKVYKLNTVTYGTSSAPYLAVRCLEELALRDGSDLPLAQQALINDFYMDDLLTGIDDLEQAVELQEQMDQLVERGKFKLRKWRANDKGITSKLEEDGKTDSLLILNRHEALKTLGLLWNSQDDTLQYSVFNGGERIMTKRLILSEISKIFDPLGLIGPVLITAKLIMQELWKQELEWDVPVSNTLHTAWSSYCNSLELINNLRIPRNVKPYNTYQKFDLHGFCDASEKAYGACIYVSCTDDQGRVSTRLMCSKSKVAPLKTLSIPRLELCGALLLSRLLAAVIRSLKITSNHTYLWTDSQIVLAWIRTQPYQLKTFVSNRVAEIQQLTEGADWNHVPTGSNPADLLSRGISTAELSTADLWWHGPNWLSDQDNWPEADKNDNDLQVSELKTTVTMAVTDDINPLLRRYSSFLKLKRVVAYCLRFVAKCKGIKFDNTLTVEEMEQAEVNILKLTQKEVFSSEITHLSRGSPLHPKSKLLSLKPILDPRGIIRVGGRLQYADIPYDHRHPIILPARHHITTLILTDEHQRLLHCGSEHLLSSIRLKYWPLTGRREARKITTRCVTCFRVQPRNMEATMANLPHARVEGFCKPFATAGIDFAGPLQIREGRRRGRIPISKGYIAVFVCFNTKAIHLELVGDLSTESFLAALNRFIARRGMCSHLYSDNGTNFVGANRELKEIYDLLAQNQTQISTQLANQKITWHFIPPRSPNFGGLWEAAVKSAKRHLYKVARNLIMTFEECYTLLTQIESVLNSRPLTPLSSNPDDLLALTPAHFLLGDSQNEPCQSDVSDVSDNRLSRWQHLQKVRQHFWNRWQREYLHQLQTCTKWQQDTANLKPGTMVLISEDNLTPLRWPLGRVLEVHPGQDGVTRVATIKTATGTYQRSVRKLCALPLDLD